MECRLINNPINGERVKSKLWNDLFMRTMSAEKADIAYQNTLSDSFVNKFGNWVQGTYILPVNEIGEPLLTKNVYKETTNINNLENKLKDFISRSGFNISYDRAVSKLGSPIGVLDFFNKTITLKGDSDIETLTEESIHLYVEILRENNSALYNGLRNDLYDKYYHVLQTVRQDYKEYYGTNDYLMMDEAIGKILTARLLNKYSFGQKEDARIDSWFKKVLSFFKGLLNTSKEQFDDFFDLAIDSFINDNNVYSLDTKDKKMYQLNNEATKKQKEIVDKILSENLQAVYIDSKGRSNAERTSTEDKRKYLDNNTGETLGTVHDEIEKNKPKNLTTTQELEEKAQATSEFGTQGHEDITNIIERQLQKIQGVEQKPKTENLGKEIYNQLEGYFAKWVQEKLKIDSNGVFVLEKPIRDNRKAGTPDLLFIESDGTVHIHDWKYVSYSTTEDGKVKEDSIKQGRRNEWTTQMQSYKDMLSKRYGVKKFGQLRFKPIAAFYKKINDKYVIDKIEIGDNKAYLRDIPLESEKTGDRELDALLSATITKRNQLLKRSYPTQEQYQKAQDEALALRQVIERLQIGRNTNALLRYLKSEKEAVSDGLKNADTRSLLKAKDLLEYGDLVKNFYINSIKQDSSEYKKFQDILNEFDILRNIFNNKISEYKESKNIDDINYSVGSLQSTTQMLHQFKNSAYQYFNGLKESAFDAVDKQITDFNNFVKSKMSEMKSQGNTFNDIIEENENGYSLVSKFKRDFYKELQKADVKWLENNIEIVSTVLDDDGNEIDAYEDYKKRREIQKKLYDERYDSTDAKRLLANWEYRNNVFEDKYKIEAMKYYQSKSYHRYLQPKTQWINDKYKWLEQNKDKAISQLYFKFVEINKRGNKVNDKHIKNNFIPMIEKSIIDNIFKNGINVSKIKDQFVKDLTYYEQDEGRLKVKYTNHIDKEDVSLDLGNVFSQYAYSVFYTEQFTQLEDESRIIQNILSTGKYYKIDNEGKIKYENGQPVVIDYLSKDTTELSDINRTVDTFVSFADYYVRGIRNKSKDISFNLFGINVSSLKVVENLQSWMSSNALAFNPISATVNLMGGLANLHIVATKGKFFDNSNIFSAEKDITSGNRKALQLAKLFQVSSTNSNYSNAKDLSQNKLKIDNELLYIMQRKGEEFVQNTSLLAYLKHNTINEKGDIVKADRNNSLYDILIKDDGTVNTEVLTETMYNTIRRRVRALNNEVMGSMSERDYVIANQYLLGRLMLQFRRWALPMTKARFGALGYNDNLEMYEEGRYRQGVKMLINNKLDMLPLIKDAITLKFNGEYKGMQELYNQALEKNPDLKMDFTEFQEFYLRNLRATLGEAAITLSLLGILYGMKGEDDDEETSNYRSFATKVMQRTASELMFWVDYDSADRIIQSPIPLIGLYRNIQNIKNAVSKDIESEEEHTNTITSLVKLTPLSSILRLEKQLEEISND